MLTLDDTDQKLLSLLRSNARISIVHLAKKLGLARATVQNRLRRLEEREIILGYTVLIGSEIENPEVRAFMAIGVESVKEARVIEKLRGNPQVSAVHHTTGHWDLIAEIHADSLASYNKIVGAIRLIEGVTSTETNLLLDSYK
jgi:DNA-binding Lrp family transcriptional regulator